MIPDFETLEFLLRTRVPNRNVHDFPIANGGARLNGERGIVGGNVVYPRVRQLFGYFRHENPRKQQRSSDQKKTHRGQKPL